MLTFELCFKLYEAFQETEGRCVEFLGHCPDTEAAQISKLQLWFLIGCLLGQCK